MHILQKKRQPYNTAQYSAALLDGEVTSIQKVEDIMAMQKQLGGQREAERAVTEELQGKLDDTCERLDKMMLAPEGIAKVMEASTPPYFDGSKKIKEIDSKEKSMKNGDESSDNQSNNSTSDDEEPNKSTDRREKKQASSATSCGKQTTFVEVGPIWSQHHAVIKAQEHIDEHPNLEWTGHWKTTVPCRMSVIQVREK